MNDNKNTTTKINNHLEYEKENSKSQTKNYKNLNISFLDGEEREKKSKDSEEDLGFVFQEKLRKEYEEYKKMTSFIHPGNKDLKTNYSKLISLMNTQKDYLKPPEEQEKLISGISDIFKSSTYNPKFLELYSDFLHHDMLKDLEFRNTPIETRKVLREFYIRKFFKLNNMLEKVLSKYNTLKNFNTEDDFILYNNQGSINKNKDLVESMEKKDDNLQKSDSDVHHFNKKRNLFTKFNQEREKQKGEKDETTFINSLHEEYVTDDKEKDYSYNAFELFTGYKNYKVFRLNQEIEQTIQRVMRLSSPEEADHNKDFEFFLKHYKLKKLESIFLKYEQIDTKYHHRIDDLNIYFKEQCYKEKLNFQLEYFKPAISFMCFKKGVQIWKNSRIYLYNKISNDFTKKMTKINSILNEEKDTPFIDSKLCKEYFRNKYLFYYKFKEALDETKDEIKSIHLTYYYDRVHPPLALTVNSEIKSGIKELCDYFNISFDITIDGGRAFSYSVDLFYPMYFEKQSNNFKFIPYEFSVRDFNQLNQNRKGNKTEESKENKEEVNLINKPSSVLRNKYSLEDGFIVNNNEQNKIYDIISKQANPFYLKKSFWLDNICVKAKRNEKFEIFLKKLNEIGYVDSLIKYELELIDIVDLSTLNRLVDEYSNTINKRVIQTIKIMHQKATRQDITDFKHIVQTIVKNQAVDSGIVNIKGSKPTFQYKKDQEDPLFNSIFNVKQEESTGNEKDDYLIHNNPHQFNSYNQEYAKLVDSDILKYFLILRYLKLRDLKYKILSYLNYFRFIQKKFAIDCYKLENKSWKKSNDFEFLTKAFSENWMAGKDPPETKQDINTVFYLNELIHKQPMSSMKYSNPVLPSLETFLNPTGEGNFSLLDSGKKSHNSSLFIKVLADEYDEIPNFTDEKGIQIIDSHNNTIIYDSAISDLKDLERHFALIGTYYINAKESLVINTEQMPNSLIDRTEVILDLFSCEVDYLNSKFELISEMFDVYENTTDIIYQKKLMGIITDVIAQRPEIDLEQNYFTNCYKIASEIFNKKSAFFHTISDYQKKIEFDENKTFYEALDKTVFLYGEAALEIIRHVKVDKRELELLKSYVFNKKKPKKTESKERAIKEGKEEISIEEIKLLIEIFEQNNTIKEYYIEGVDDDEADEERVNEKNKEKQKEKEKEKLNEAKSVKSGKSKQKSGNSKVEKEKEKTFTESSMEEKEKEKTFKSMVELKDKSAIIEESEKEKEKECLKKLKKTVITKEKTISKFNKLINFLKSLIKKSLLGETGEIESINSTLIEDTLNSDEYTSLKEIIDFSISKSAPKRNLYNITSRKNSLSINDDDFDSAKLNFKVRSILNLPSPLNFDSYTEFIKTNKKLIPDIQRYLKFVALEEGNPFKISESDALSSNIEFYDSQEIIVDVYELSEDSAVKTTNMFDYESNISSKAVEIAFYDALIEEWDIYKEYASGRTKSSQLESLYFLQDTLLDNHQSIAYLMKNLFSILSQPIEKIPPQILCKLNIEKIERLKFEGADRFGSIFDEASLTSSPSKRLLSTVESKEKEREREEIEEGLLNQKYVKEDLFNVLSNYVNEELSKEYLNLEKENLLTSENYKGNTMLSQVYIYANLLEMYRSKKILMKVMSNIIQLKEIFEAQKEEILNRQENLIQIEKKFCFESPETLKSSFNFVDCADKAFFKQSRFNISEFDLSFENCSHLYDTNVNIMNLLNPSEFKLLCFHEYMHYYMLLIAIQHNNAFYLPFNQSFAELEMYNTHRIISYHRKIDLNFSNTNETLELNLHQYRSKLVHKLSLIGNELFYKISQKKMRNANNIAEKYNDFNEKKIRPLYTNHIIKKVYLREFRKNLCASYLKDILIEVMVDGIKLQALQEVRDLKQKAMAIQLNAKYLRLIMNHS